MSLPEKDALLIFCEGDHDVAVLRMLLKDHFKLTEEAWKFSDFPAPLNSIFPQRMRAHAASDLELGLAHEFFLPNHVFSKESRIVLLFRTGGDRKIALLKEFLGVLNHMLTAGTMFPQGSSKIRNINYLFIHDADANASSAMQNVYNNFNKIKNTPWLVTPWQADPNNALAAYSGNKSIYIWSSNGTTGTLEDLIYPAFAQKLPDLTEKSSAAAIDIFGEAGSSVAKQADRKKAVITIAGQDKKPGSGLHLILAQGKILDGHDLLKIPAIQKFSDFLDKNIASLSNE